MQGQDRLKARSIVLIALATTYVQQQEIEEAYRPASEALNIAPPQRIGPIAQRVADLRGRLEPWRGTGPVNELDEQLADLAAVKLGRVGIWTYQLNFHPASRVRDVVAELEALGYGAIWVGEGAYREPLTNAAILPTATSRMVVATGIANI